MIKLLFQTMFLFLENIQFVENELLETKEELLDEKQKKKKQKKTLLDQITFLTNRFTSKFLRFWYQ